MDRAAGTNLYQTNENKENAVIIKREQSRGIKKEQQDDPNGMNKNDNKNAKEGNDAMQKTEESEEAREEREKGDERERQEKRARERKNPPNPLHTHATQTQTHTHKCPHTCTHSSRKVAIWCRNL